LHHHVDTQTVDRASFRRRAKQAYVQCKPAGFRNPTILLYRLSRRNLCNLTARNPFENAFDAKQLGAKRKQREAGEKNGESTTITVPVHSLACASRLVCASRSTPLSSNTIQSSPAAAFITV
jgi:hypothetical protein